MIKSNKMRISTVLFISVITFTFLFAAIPANAKPSSSVINVYPGQSIQTAVSTVPAGGKVVVNAGTYHEQVIVSKTLTLLSNGAIIDLDGVSFAAPYNAGIYVDAPDVTVSGFTIRNVPFYPPQAVLPYAFAICFVGSSSNGVIRNNIVESQYMGIGVTSNRDTPTTNYTEISNVEVRNNQISAVFALWITNVNNAVVRNNQIAAIVNPAYPTQQPSGISIMQFAGTGSPTPPPAPTLANVTIRNNIVTSECAGININGNTAAGGITGVEVRNNIVTMAPLNVQFTNSNPIAAISAGNAPSVLIRNNFILAKAPTYGSNLPQPLGIRLTGISNNALVEKNEMTSDFAGIRLNGPVGVTIQKNTVHSAIDSIDTVGYAANFIIRENVLVAKANSLFTQYPYCIKLGASYVGGVIEDNEMDSDYYGIWVNGQQGIQVRNNTIYNSIFAVQADNAPSITIYNNSLTAKANAAYPGVTPNGILLNGGFSGGTLNSNIISSEGYGIYMSGGQSNIEIDGNNIDARNGVFANSGTGFTVTNNKINAAMDGITLNNMGMTTVITKNVVYSGNYGISLSSISGATVEYNEVHINKNTNDVPTGILLSGSTSSQFAMNIVTGDFISGIILFGSNLNTFDKNVITGVYRYDARWPDAGIRLWGGSNDNTGTENLITGVDLAIEDQGAGNVFTP